MRLGKSVARAETTCREGQVGSRDAEKKIPELSRHQTFRLTEDEKRRLYLLAEQREVKVSTLLRALVQKAVTDGE